MKKFLMILVFFLCQQSFAQNIEVITKSIVNCEGGRSFPVGIVTPEELALSKKNITAALTLYKRQPCYPLRTYISIVATITRAASSGSSSKSSVKSSSSNPSSKSSASSAAGPTGPITILTATGSTEYGGNAAKNAVDGVSSTRWESEWRTDPSWLVMDLGAARAVGSIEIDWEDSNAKVYTVQGSNDASSWSDIASKNDGVNFQRTDTLKLSGSHRYLRIYATVRTPEAAWGYSIYEVRVIGAAAKSSSSMSRSASSKSAASSAAPGVPVTGRIIQPTTRENGDALPLDKIGGYLVYRLGASGTMDAVDIKPQPTPEMDFSLPFLVGDSDVVEIAAYDTDGLYSKRVVMSR